MNAKKFSDAMSEIDDKYIMEALIERKPRLLHLRWWKFHKVAACFSVAILVAVFSFGTAFAVSADFRQVVTSYLFPIYTENQLYEIEEGHRTGSFSMEDTLFSFFEKFNNENMVDNITIKHDNGFEYVILANGENSVDVIVECTTPNDKLLVVMERNDYKETTGLWQVIAYQILDSKTANEMIDHRQSNNPHFKKE